MYVYFDLDDTLFDEGAFCRSAYSEIAFRLSNTYDRDLSYIVDKMTGVLRERKNPFNWLKSELQRLELIPAVNTAENISEDCGADAVPPDEAYIKPLVEIYRNHAPAVLPLSPDVKRTLDALVKRGYKLGIITDGRSITQRNKIKALGLEEYFSPEDILISGECGADKTSDLMFRKAMEMHPGETFAYVGDNTAKDFRQPNLLGWTTFCLRHMRPMIHPQDFNATWPDAPARIISSFPELLLLLPR